MERGEQSLRALLGGTFLFRGAPEEAVDAALADVRTLRVQAARGQVIYDRLHFRRCLGVVVEGAVQVSKGPLIMSVLKRGDLFGAAALFHEQEGYVTTLRACVPCRLLLLPQALVEELMERYPQVARSYVCYLSQRIRFLSGKIDALTAGSTERKLTRYLLANRRDGAVVLDCSATGLAGRLGVSRASLYRAIDRLTETGSIRRQGRRVTILDENALGKDEI